MVPPRPGPTGSAQNGEYGAHSRPGTEGVRRVWQSAAVADDILEFRDRIVPLFGLGQGNLLAFQIADWCAIKQSKMVEIGCQSGAGDLDSIQRGIASEFISAF